MGSRNVGDVYADETDGVQVAAAIPPFALFPSLSLYLSAHSLYSARSLFYLDINILRMFSSCFQSGL